MRRNGVLLSILCFVTLSSTAVAQFEAESGIQGSGNVTLERTAERMRMQISLLAKSTKDLPDALTKLKALRAKADKQMQTLGVIKDSVKYGEPRVDSSQDDSQRRMQMMMQRRMNQLGNRRAEKEKEIKIVRVSMKLTAEWPMKGADAAGLLIEATKLQDAIKAADLGGLKEAEEPTEEEAEVQEEMDQMQMDFGQNGPKPGEADFVFVATISDADREKARADAFKAARTEAMQLAKAADVPLGELIRLSSNFAAVGDGDDEVQAMYNRGYGHMYQRYMNNSSTAEPLEAMGTTPGTLKCRVGVMAAFTIKPSDKNSK